IEIFGIFASNITFDLAQNSSHRVVGLSILSGHFVECDFDAFHIGIVAFRTRWLLGFLWSFRNFRFLLFSIFALFLFGGFLNLLSPKSLALDPLKKFLETADYEFDRCQNLLTDR